MHNTIIHHLLTDVQPTPNSDQSLLANFPDYILLICYMEYPSGQLGPPVLSSCHTSSLIEHEAFKSAGFKTSTAQKQAEHPPVFYRHYSHTESKIQLLGRKFTGLQLKSGHRNPLHIISVYFL